MRQGVDVVIQHLNTVKPRVILTMEHRTHNLLTEILLHQYEIRRPIFGDIRLLSMNTRKGTRYHRQVDAYTIVGKGLLNGCFVIRCPQHPARIFNKDYASRVARALRHVLVCMATHMEPITINEQ